MKIKKIFKKKPKIYKLYNNSGILICSDILKGLRLLKSESVQCVVTSPPYWGLRDYGIKKQLGLESTPEEYVNNMVKVFREIKRILRKDGTVWLNLGDSYWGSGNASGHTQETKNSGRKTKDYGATKGHSCKKHPILKPKDLVGIPWRVAFALQKDGWYLRQDIIWSKGNPMPESVIDRCTKSHEYIFLLTKNRSYYYDSKSIEEKALATWNSSKNFKGKKVAEAKEKGEDVKFYRTRGYNTYHEDKDKNIRNKRSVWNVNTAPYKGAHFATFPSKLIKPCILAGAPEQRFVLDPFMGSGTTASECIKTRRYFIGIELNKKYFKIEIKRMSKIVKREWWRKV